MIKLLHSPARGGVGVPTEGRNTTSKLNKYLFIPLAYGHSPLKSGRAVINTSPRWRVEVSACRRRGETTSKLKKYQSIPLALRALPLKKWESCDKLLHSPARGRRETVAPFATPMRNKHCLRRREIYLPRGVCLGTKIYLPRGVPEGPCKTEGSCKQHCDNVFVLRQKYRRTKDLFAMGKECRNVSHATMNCVDIWQWENKFSP